MTTCPCGSELAIQDCCGPIIDGAPAPTAEALMRARYTAFVTKMIGDFLKNTITDERRRDFDQREVEMSARDAEGLGFEIRALEGGGLEDERGSVEYIARFNIRGNIQTHHELATFRRENGLWLYEDGEVNPKQAPRTVVKIGRNDPCSCGSGKKYKKCCGA
jgi:SEC-C motif-containing protein